MTFIPIPCIWQKNFFLCSVFHFDKDKPFCLFEAPTGLGNFVLLLVVPWCRVTPAPLCTTGSKTEWLICSWSDDDFWPGIRLCIVNYWFITMMCTIVVEQGSSHGLIVLILFIYVCSISELPLWKMSTVILKPGQEIVPRHIPYHENPSMWHCKNFRCCISIYTLIEGNVKLTNILNGSWTCIVSFNFIIFTYY